MLNGFKQEAAAQRAKTLIGTMSDEEKLSMFLTIFNSFLVDLNILHELVNCFKFEPVDLVEYFKNLYGDEFQRDLKDHIDFVLSTTTDNLPKHHKRRYEIWMNMVNLERDRWGTIEGKADFGLFDSFKIMLYPKDLVTTFTAVADSATYIYNSAVAA